MTQNLTKIAADIAKRPETSLADILVEAFTPDTASNSTLPSAVKAPELTEAHLSALSALPEVFGKINPTTPRELTAEESKALVEEREVVDLLLTLLTSRKNGTLREHLANHLDRLAEKEGLVEEQAETDSKGHYFIKQDVPVDGTDRKIQRTVSKPKPVIDSAALQQMHEDGDLTREEFLSLTSIPEVPRVFDEAKARKAIRKNPGLLVKVAQATTRKDPVIAIKIAKA